MKKIHFAAMLVSIIALGTVCSAFQKNTGSDTVSVDSGFRLLGTMSYARAAHTSTRLADGKVLIAGGMLENGAFYDSVEIFDPVKNSFETLKSKMIKQRVSQTATLLNDGRVLFVGGWSNRNAPEDTAEIFDPKTGNFESIAKLEHKRSGHTAVLLTDGKVMIAGGSDGSNYLTAIEIFDPLQNHFETGGKLTTPRASHTVTLLDDGRILFAGGQDTDSTVTASVEVFDPQNGKSVLQEATMGTARYKHDAVKLLDGKVILFGGSGKGDRGERLRLSEIFDPSNGKIEKAGDLNKPRFKISGTSVLLSDGRVLAAGGNDQPEIFDPKTRTFSIVEGTFGEAHHFATTTLLEDGRALIIGGYHYRTNAGPLSTNQVWAFRSAA